MGGYEVGRYTWVDMGRYMCLGGYEGTWYVGRYQVCG